MTYKECIQDIIVNRGQWGLDENDYFEQHHIIPVCIGGSGDKEDGRFKHHSHHQNCIWLTAREHFIAHKLLMIENPDNSKLAYAWICMSRCNKFQNRQIDESEYELLKKTYSKLAMNKIWTEAERQKLSRSLKGVKKPKRSDEHILHLKQARDFHSTTKGKRAVYNKELDKVKFVNESEVDEYLKYGWVLGSKPLTAEAKEKIGKSNSISLKGKKHQEIKSGKLNSGLVGSKVICVETGSIFESINEAKQWLYNKTGIDGCHIKDCCTAHSKMNNSNSRKMTGGYHWMFYEDYLKYNNIKGDN